MTQDQIKAIRDEYEPVIRAKFAEWQIAFTAAGYRTSDTDEVTDDCYRWSFAVYLDDEEPESEAKNAVDVSFTFAESGPYAGDRLPNGDSEGINILLDVVHVGGRMLGSFSPYNYTSRVWTDDPYDIRDRMKAFSQIDASEILSSLERA